MSHELKEGAMLERVVGPRCGEYCEGLLFIVGEKDWHYKSITVEMQPGQMGMVPWAKAIRNDGEVRMANLALMEEVVLLTDKVENAGVKS